MEEGSMSRKTLKTIATLAACLLYTSDAADE